MKGDDDVADEATSTRSPPPPTRSPPRIPSFYVGEAGSISSGKALDKMFNEQLAQAGERSVPLTLLILLLVFGAIVAAGVPLLLALSAVLATIGLVALPSHIVPMDSNVSAVLLLVGLAVGVDYSLFYLKREREERAAGKSPPRRARGRRRHVGPLGADLGRDRDDRDGRDAVLRRQDVPVVRHRHDDGRRRRDARLADRPAGAALEARRPGREGPDPVPDRLRRDERRQPLLVGDPHPGAQAPARLGDRRRRRAARAWRSRC